MSTYEDGRRAAARLNDGSIDIQTFLGWLDPKTRAKLGSAALRIESATAIEEGPAHTGVCVTLIACGDTWRPVAQTIMPHMVGVLASQRAELQRLLAPQEGTPAECRECHGTGRCPICDDVWPDSADCGERNPSAHGAEGSCAMCEGTGRLRG